MQGKLCVITGIPFTKYKNPMTFYKQMEKKFTPLLLAEQKKIAEKYDERYTTCYVNIDDPVDMSAIPDDIIIKKVSWMASMHVIFEITDEKGE